MTRTYVAERGDDAAPPWEAAAGDVNDRQWTLQQEFRQLSMAFAQLLHGGSDAQLDAARKELADTRRALYGILADEEPS